MRATEAVNGNTRWSNREWILLGVLIALGAAARLYHLGQQSLWMDEYYSVCFLGNSSLSNYLRMVQICFPEQMTSPLYYLLQYGWASIFGTHEYALRLFPVCLGIAGLPVAYLFGRYFAGRWGGFVAGLCLALSPQHVWYSQEPRPYTLLTPLVMLSLYALLRAYREEKRRWWAVNLLCNTALVLTHAFAGLVLGVEGLFLLSRGRAGFRRTAYWSIVQGLLLIPWLFLVAHVPYTHSFYSSVSLGEVIKEVFLDDVISYHSDLLPAWKTNGPDAVTPFENILLPWRPFFDTALLLTLGALLFVSIARAVRLRSCELRENVFALLLLFVLPGSTLGFLNMALHKPFVGPMYAMYNTVALYAVAGIAIGAFRRISWRVTGVCVLAALYLFQLGILIPGPTRTDWRKSAEYIFQECAPEDLVLSVQPFFPAPLLDYYLQPHGIRAQRSVTFEDSLTQACDYFSRQPETDKVRQVWLVFSAYDITSVYPCFDLLGEVERALTVRHLAFNRRLFPGHYNVYVYSITENAQESCPAAAPFPTFTLFDFKTALQELGMSFSTPESQERAIKALRDTIIVWPPYGPSFAHFNSLDLLVEKHLDLAEAMGKYAGELAPNYGLAHFELGLVYAARGDDLLARETFEHAYALYPGMKEVMAVFVDSLLANDKEVCSRELVHLESGGYLYLTAAMRTAWEIRTAPGKNAAASPTS